MIELRSQPNLAFFAAFLSLMSVQTGAAIAKTLFPIFGSDTVAFIRLSLSAVLLWIIFQPWKGLDKAVKWNNLLVYGIILALMNIFIYKAFSYLSVGVTISIEVLGPLVVAIFVSRHKLDLLWGALAGMGLLLLPLGKSNHDFSYMGMLYALAAASCWGFYIIYGSKVAHGGGKAVAIGVTIATLCVSLLNTINIQPLSISTHVLLLCVLVSVLSSTIPFLLDIFAMKTLTPKVFGILLSASPMISAVVGWLVLGETLTIFQFLGMAIIMIACSGCLFFSRKTIL